MIDLKLHCPFPDLRILTVDFRITTLGAIRIVFGRSARFEEICCIKISEA